MGRPSLKEQRSAEILDAFGRCVARYGVEGSTLERIAEEAGVKRTILRHYVGNRNDLISALSIRIEREFHCRTEALFNMLPSTRRISRLIDALFDPANQTDSNDVAIAQALISASDLYPDTAARLSSWVQRFDELLCAELIAEYPKASQSAIQAVSFGILGIYFNADALAPLRLPGRFNTAAKAAARRLIGTLEK